MPVESAQGGLILMGEGEGKQSSDGLDECERVARSEVMLGCGKVREMEETLKLAATGCLSFTDSSNHAKAVREDLTASAEAIVSNFSTFISILNSSISQRISASAEMAALYGNVDRTDNLMGAMREEQYEEAADVSCQKIGSPIATARPLEAQYYSSPSPSLANYDQRESLQTNANEQASTSKRRKLGMTKRMFKVPIESLDPGKDMPPPDGFIWRKYGQKPILGSQHPRSYYRCSYQRELGCPAVKYVQRSDDDPPVLDITLKGEHTCFSLKNPCSTWIYSPIPLALAATSPYPTDPHILEKPTSDLHILTKPTSDPHILTIPTSQFRQFNNPNPISSSSMPDVGILSLPFPAMTNLMDGSTTQSRNPGDASASILSPEFTTPKFGFYSCPQFFRSRDGAPGRGLVSSGNCSNNSSFQTDESNAKDSWRESKNECKSEAATELPDSPSRQNTTEFICSDSIDFVFQYPGAAFQSADTKQLELSTSCEKLPSPETLSVLQDSLPSSTIQSTGMSAAPSITGMAEQKLSEIKPIGTVAENSPPNTFPVCFEMDSSEPQQHLGGINFEPVSSNDPLLFD